jgi:hypothetical protein
MVEYKKDFFGNPVYNDRVKRSKGNGVSVGLLVAFLVGIIVGLPVALLRGFGLMLAVGIVHADLFPNVPTLGYWISVGLAWAIAVAFGSYSSNSTTTK